MQPFFNPYLVPTFPPNPVQQGPYGNSVLLNEIHNYFPALIYDNLQFRSSRDVMNYIQNQMRFRFDTFSNAQEMYRASMVQQAYQAQMRAPPVQTRDTTDFPNIQIRSRTIPFVWGDTNIDTLFNSLLGLPGTFADAVPITPSAQELEQGSIVYEAINESPCAICQDTIAAGNFVRKIRACNHVFHSDCIDTWFQRSPLCPQCRSDVRTPPTVPQPSQPRTSL